MSSCPGFSEGCFRVWCLFAWAFRHSVLGFGVFFARAFQHSVLGFGVFLPGLFGIVSRVWCLVARAFRHGVKHPGPKP